MFLAALVMLLGERLTDFVFDYLLEYGCERSLQNTIKFVFRPFFTMNFIASAVFIAGQKERGGIRASMDSVDRYGEDVSFYFAQMVSAFYLQSFFFYFDTVTRPVGFCNEFFVFMLDILLFNWIRLIMNIFKAIVRAVLLPFSFIALLCTCRDSLNAAPADDEQSACYSFASALLSGLHKSTG